MKAQSGGEHVSMCTAWLGVAWGCRPASKEELNTSSRTHMDPDMENPLWRPWHAPSSWWGTTTELQLCVRVHMCLCVWCVRVCTRAYMCARMGVSVQECVLAGVPVLGPELF